MRDVASTTSQSNPSVATARASTSSSRGVSETMIKTVSVTVPLQSRLEHAGVARNPQSLAGSQVALLLGHIRKDLLRSADHGLVDHPRVTIRRRPQLERNLYPRSRLPGLAQHPSARPSASSLGASRRATGRSAAARSGHETDNELVSDFDDAIVDLKWPTDEAPHRPPGASRLTRADTY